MYSQKMREKENDSRELGLRLFGDAALQELELAPRVHGPRVRHGLAPDLTRKRKGHLWREI